MTVVVHLLFEGLCFIRYIKASTIGHLGTSRTMYHAHRDTSLQVFHAPQERKPDASIPEILHDLTAVRVISQQAAEITRSAQSSICGSGYGTGTAERGRISFAEDLPILLRRGIEIGKNEINVCITGKKHFFWHRALLTYCSESW